MSSASRIFQIRLKRQCMHVIHQNNNLCTVILSSFFSVFGCCMLKPIFVLYFMPAEIILLQHCPWCLAKILILTHSINGIKSFIFQICQNHENILYFWNRINNSSNDINFAYMIFIQSWNRMRSKWCWKNILYIWTDPSGRIFIFIS